jgi:tubulin-folding cofactor B
MQIGQRCQLENGARGEIKYIGKVIDIGYGWFIGIELDQPVPGFGDGTVEGMYYFMCDIGKGVF